MVTRHGRRKAVAKLLLLLVGFSVAVSALGASEVQNHSGGSWIHAFLVNLPVSLAFSTPVGVVIAFNLRDRGDQMPAALWRERPPSPDSQTYSLSRSYRLVRVGIYVCMLLAAPFFAFSALRTGASATILFGCWLVGVIFVVRSERRSQPWSLTLNADELLVLTPGGPERHVPISAVSAISWPYWGGHVQIHYEGGTLNVPKQVKRLDDLVVKLRRRNSAIRFNGKWPPARATLWPR
jgi:hypothetical protein